jgi:hypothetical protein
MELTQLNISAILKANVKVKNKMKHNLNIRERATIAALPVFW